MQIKDGFQIRNRHKILHIFHTKFGQKPKSKKIVIFLRLSREKGLLSVWWPSLPINWNAAFDTL